MCTLMLWLNKTKQNKILIKSFNRYVYIDVLKGNKYIYFRKILEIIKKSQNNFNYDLIKLISDKIFEIAGYDNDGFLIKYILENSEKYPFLINSIDKNNNCLFNIISNYIEFFC